MATLVLGAAGAAIGGAIGGTFLGISAAAIGQAVGATIGSVVDQTLFAPSLTVKTGRIETYRLQTASEGVPIPHSFGRMRVGAQLIWRDTFTELVNKSTQGGGKGGGGSVTTKEYTYTVNLALALGEGEVQRVGRIWADGEEIPADEITYSLYHGTDDQLPDDTIEAIEGAGNVPAFRGTAYIVIKDLDVTQFGNRIPQFNVEVFRAAQPAIPAPSAARDLQAVCMIPGSGEFVYGTTLVTHKIRKGKEETTNGFARLGKGDIASSIAQLKAELPNVKTVSLVVSWFGDNLECGSCAISPRVDLARKETRPYTWSVSGRDRANTPVVSTIDDKPAFGGTPSDQSVQEAITALKAAGYEVVLYPFVMMDIPADTVSNDPYGADFQSAYPWRGLITSAEDQTAQARDAATTFFGNTEAVDFSVSSTDVQLNINQSFGYRGMVLHYAHLAETVGGVDGFIIGSELRGLTRLRDDQDAFPAVDHLRTLLHDVRSVLREGTEIGYAADWSEYFGYQPSDGSGDVFYNLDPLWMEPDLDFVGVDFYPPITDWRETSDHLDDTYKSSRDPAYLADRIAGGEGFDWYYPSQTDRDLQNRVPINDGAYGQDWVFRVKDLHAWWTNPHHERRGGVITNASVWQPGAKPFWLTEFGCPAVRNGANEPNIFPDPKTDQAQLPQYSDGSYDPVMQEAYLVATHNHFVQNNRIHPDTGVSMMRTDRMFAWTWDARPWPEFPARDDIWSDVPQHSTGHWLTGRFSGALLADVVAELCEAAGVIDYDVSALEGRVTGATHFGGDSPRTVLQALSEAFELAIADRAGTLHFFPHECATGHTLDLSQRVQPEEGASLSRERTPETERPDAVSVRFYDASGHYETAVAGAGRPGAHLPEVGALFDLPIAADESLMRPCAERLLRKSRFEADTLSFSVPQSNRALRVGDRLHDGGLDYRITSVTDGLSRAIEAVGTPLRTQAAVSGAPSLVAPLIPAKPAQPDAYVLELPYIAEPAEGLPIFIAASADPWGGGVAIYEGSEVEGYALLGTMPNASIIGELRSELPRSTSDIWSKGQTFSVLFSETTLQSQTELSVLNGANGFAVGTPETGYEILQAASIAYQPDGTAILSDLIRGARGSEAVIPDIWPAGTPIISLNSPLFALTRDLSDWDQTINYRIGPVASAPSEDTFVPISLVPQGTAIKPYAPAHLTARQNTFGDVTLSWVPRVALDGESWSGEILSPYTSYLVQVIIGGSTVREVEVTDTGWVYSSADRTADGFTSGIFAVSANGGVAGYGFQARINFNG
ncbi:MAG: glycoside hydrolase/phage tail family protein [Pseudomonadota bacterium]